MLYERLNIIHINTKFNVASHFNKPLWTGSM